MENFADRLFRAVESKGNPLCVGLDPRLDPVQRAVGGGKPFQSLEDAAQAVETFCLGVIDVVAPIAPVVKPQVAFFEQFGPPGVAAFRNVVQAAVDAGLLVIGDGKRNDIGSTAEGYAAAYLGEVTVGEKAYRPFPVDALTVNAYLGTDGIAPFCRQAGAFGTGIFVLVKTSNPSAGELQDLMAGGNSVYEHMADLVNRWGEELVGEMGYASVGAVVGATYPEIGLALRKRLPKTPFLVPGYGAQGGTAETLGPLFDDRGLGAVVNSSRGVIFAFDRDPYKDRFGLADWKGAVEAAARDAAEQLAVAAGLT